MESNAILTYITLAVSIGSVVLGIINHRRIRSNCCGRLHTVSLDIEHTGASVSPLLEKKPEIK